MKVGVKYMPYKYSELKEIGLRVAKTINHDLQKSKMNQYFKPYFTESSIQFINNDEHCGIILNKDAIDLEDAIDEIKQTRFVNNMKFLNETVNRYLTKNKLNDYFQLRSYSEDAELFELDESYLSKNKNFILSIKKEACPDIPMMYDDIENKKSTETGNNYPAISYYTLPENLANDTFNDLKKEVSVEDVLRVLADPQQGKNSVSNSSHYKDLEYNVEVGTDITL
jgi:hypothetical protein